MSDFDLTAHMMTWTFPNQRMVIGVGCINVENDPFVVEVDADKVT